MAKRKAGLQKKISSIFDGVPVPTQQEQEQEQEQSASAPPPQADYPTPKTPAPALAPPSIPRLKVQTAPTRNQTPKPSYPKPQKPKERPAQRIETPASVKRKIVTAPSDDNHSPKQKKMMALVGVLAVAFIVILARNFMPAAGTPRPTDATEGPAEAVVTAHLTADIKIDWEKPDLFPQLTHNPMARPQPKPEPEPEPEPEPVIEPPPPVQDPPDNANLLPELVVKGIVHSDDRPAALIGDIMVHEGEIIFGCTILKIRRFSVDFEKDGKKWNQQVQRAKNIKDKEGKFN